MKLMEVILQDENLEEAIKRVKSNKGVAGVDKMTVDEIDEYFKSNKETIKKQILEKKYRPQPVRRVYIPKSNGRKRPLGIPTVVDRVIQQAIAQVLTKIYDDTFSDNSFGFRPNRSAQNAIMRTLDYLNEGYEWVVDLDIEAYFDTVNHDKLISILRERVFDSATLHLVRKFLQAGIMEKGLVKSNTIGMPQGGPLSPILSNIYLDKFDKELEQRGLHFVRYADDSNIFVKSEMAANRVMKSVTSWLERKLFLKVSSTKTKVVRPTNSNFLGFTYWKGSSKWECKPTKKSKKSLYDKCRKELIRKKCVAQTNAKTFTRINQIVKGWINYFRIGRMKNFIDEFGQWLRHKIRVILLKQWKTPSRIYKNLQKLNEKLPYHFSDEQLYSVANTRLGLYKQANGNVVNFLLNADILAIRKEERPGLVNPLAYYLR
ncbi:group II intron reverse transcriptase/maturase [Faecalitalea cylindroides]|uniref:group II intron reverse transcriptase/maturase n=2 Tax=Faecalitalea cylindroides TaxID=39483 RepID=UPI00232E9A55|nr:group II intron reverse transcriptase/maturase [Faecalitalea cylindroides]MDB7952253.1 group II intron reverse transcriptase/maturase [Faecalitalea cylindroides]MDB7958910.1 group II intron reverse transcriptase/maturase [Faecalitalea cylindroides]MDB7961021.1 group II intron reverse transcriptase/maturase [Faecalitalea cylindroides]MDB7962838.1 group II intron reverse transcriptase/maturase [Faecalitalea cylindroides]MDB7964683.1 group II intron reverse transcriptase/maturase [Faecalitalea